MKKISTKVLTNYMTGQHILLYSSYCQHCANFYDILSQNPELNDSFEKLSIDYDIHTKRRPQEFYDIQQQLNFKIEEVPTIIVNSGEYVLAGEEAFKWLEYTISQANQPKEVEALAFNPNEMCGFSDCYARYGSTEMTDASQQSFKFINAPNEKIDTPQEEVDKSESQPVPTLKRAPPQRQMKFGGQSQPQTQSRQASITNKQKEIEARLQELMSQREEFTIPPPTHKVDFSA
jgi:hypothetical protein